MKMDSEIYRQALGYWNALGARERMIVAVGGAVAGVLLIYTLLWLPLQRDIERLRTDLPREHEQLLLMRSQEPRVKVLRASVPASVQSGGLLSFVEQSSQTYGIRQNIKRIEPQGNNAVSLAIDSVSFNSLVEWLANLQKQGGVRIDNATLEPLPVSGVVNARMLLRGAGS